MKSIAPPWVVYILCFDEPVDGSERHYVGITTPRRLHARCLEHQNGAGSAWTIEAHRQGISFELSRVIAADHRHAEKLVQQPGIAKRLCDHCAGRLTIGRYSAKTKPPLCAAAAALVNWG